MCVYVFFTYNSSRDLFTTDCRDVRRRLNRSNCRPPKTRCYNLDGDLAYSATINQRPSTSTLNNDAFVLPCFCVRRTLCLRPCLRVSRVRHGRRVWCGEPRVGYSRHDFSSTTVMSIRSRWINLTRTNEIRFETTTVNIFKDAREYSCKCSREIFFNFLISLRFDSVRRV